MRKKQNGTHRTQWCFCNAKRPTTLIQKIDEKKKVDEYLA